MNSNLFKFKAQPRQLCFVYFVFLSIFGALYGFWNAPFSYAMDNSLGLAYIGNYQEHSSYAAWLKSSKSLIHIIGSFGFSLGLNHDTLSTLLSTISSTIYVLGLGTIALLLIRNVIIASLTTIFLSIEPPFRLLETTYGLEVISSAHLSSVGAALAFLTIGLYIAKRGVFCNLVSFLNLSIHPILALFPLMLISIDLIRSYVFNGDWPKLSFSLSTILPTLFPIFCWAYYFVVIGRLDSLKINEENFNHYIDLWDYHRNIQLEPKIISIFVILAISFLLISTFFKPQNLDRRLPSVTLSLLTSAILVLALLPLLNIPIVSRTAEKLITGRFTAVFEPIVIIYAIAFSQEALRKTMLESKFNINLTLCTLTMATIIGSLFLKFDFFTPYFQKKLFSSNFSLALSLALVFIVFIYFVFKTYSCKSRKFQFSARKWSRISFLVVVFFILSSPFIFENQTQKTHRQLTIYCPDSSKDTVGLASGPAGVIFLQRYCVQPVLIDLSSFDYIPYVPSASTLLRAELETIYGINFGDDGAKNNILQGGFKDIWQNRSANEWAAILAKYNINFISTPSHWHLKLTKVSGTIDLNIYSLDKTKDALLK